LIISRNKNKRGEGKNSKIYQRKEKENPPITMRLRRINRLPFIVEAEVVVNGVAEASV